MSSKIINYFVACGVSNGQLDAQQLIEKSLRESQRRLSLSYKRSAAPESSSDGDNELENEDDDSEGGNEVRGSKNGRNASTFASAIGGRKRSRESWRLDAANRDLEESEDADSPHNAEVLNAFRTLNEGTGGAISSSGNNAMIKSSSALHREKISKPTKKWQARPTNWEDIAQFWSRTEGTQAKRIEATMKAYATEFAGYSEDGAYKRTLRWVKDLQDRRDVKECGGKIAYGENVDLLLFDSVLAALKEGKPLDDAILREMLLDVFESRPEPDRTALRSLLKENGGQFVFGSSWARRFFKRHNLVCRTALSRKKST